MAARKPIYFRVVYYDRDNHTINFSPIISDDTDVTNRTCEIQKTGRWVNISSTGPEKDIRRVPSIKELLSRMLEGYRYDPNLSW